LCAALLDWLTGRGVGLAKMISIGNKADLDETDILRALSGDPGTHVIVGYLESITSGEAFVRAAELVSAAKPVVMLKAGTTAAGSRAASSHTGTLAGADIAYGAAFKRCGVIRAETFEALLDYALAFSMQPLPAGGRVAIITNAGGPGIMAADAVESSGLSVAVLSGSTATALRAKLPAAASVANPIDVLGDANPERYAEAVRVAQDDPNVDAIIVLLTPQAMTRPAETAKVVAAAARGEKPLLAVFMGGADVMPGREELAAASLPDYPSPERAVAALRAMCEYSAWRSRPPRRLTRFPVNRRRVMRIINSQWNMGRLRVSEPKAKEMLKAYDFLVPEGGVALSADAAVETATRVGFPVVMKIVSPDILHKSDVGGVRLSLNTAGEVRDAFDLMMLRIPLRQAEARLEGVYVETMVPRGREVIIGMTRDAQFGPMLMFGLGGIYVEVLKDVTFHLAPITAEEAMEMLRGTKSFALLEGARGQSGVDLDAIASGLQHISQLVTDFPQIVELDINPFIVSESSAQPIVADARITLLPKETA
jgi:acyl-CoA synthetase (NDP forming)